MGQGPEPIQRTELSISGTKAIPNDKDPFAKRDHVMIDVEGFYSNNLEDGHQDFPSKNIGEGVPTNDTTVPTSPLTAMEIDNEQMLELPSTSSTLKDVTQANAATTPADLVLPATNEVTIVFADSVPAIADVLLGQSEEPTTGGQPDQPSGLDAQGIDIDARAATNAPDIADPTLPHEVAGPIFPANNTTIPVDDETAPIDSSAAEPTNEAFNLTPTIAAND